MKTSLFSSIIVILWGLPGHFGYDLSCLVFTGVWDNSCWTQQFRPAERMFSTLGQPNWLGAYLAINFFLGLYFFLKNNNKLWGLYLVLNFIGILFTRSRSAYLAIFIGSACFFGYLIWRKVDVLRKVRYVLISFILAILIFKTGIPTLDKYLTLSQKSAPTKSVSEIKSTDVTESGDIRKIVWGGAVELGKKYPWFGTGVETFAYSYYFVRSAEHNLTSEWDFIYNKAHNEYLNYLATTGFVGLAAYLLFIGAIIFNFQYLLLKKTQNRLLNISLFSSWLTILITNFFGFSTTVTNIYFFLIPAFALVTNNQLGPELKFKIPIGKKLSVFVATIVMLYVVFSLLNYYRADLLYSQANSYFDIGDYPKAASMYEQSLKYRREHVYEDKLSSTLANLAFLASSDPKNKSAVDLMQMSDWYNKSSLELSPKNVLYFKTKAKNYYLFYQITGDARDLKTANKALDQAIQLSPTDPKLFYTKSLLESLSGDDEAAFTAVNTSINLKPNFRDGYLLRAQMYKKVGDTQAATADLNYILKYINKDDDEVKQELGIP
jgi:tetratricopeptide (TPR) repeat protein